VAGERPPGTVPEVAGPAAAPPVDPYAAEREEIDKISLISYDDAPPTAALDGEQKKSGGFSESGAIPPPWPGPEHLLRLTGQSNVLRQCIDTMSTNCDQFGYRLIPIIDLEADDADKKIADAIYLERLFDAGPAAADVAEPSEADVKARRDQMALEMRKELATAGMFFSYCSDEYSFIELRNRTRVDLESIGDAYWEVTRNGLGAIAELSHVVGATIRKLSKGDPMRVKVKIRVSPISFREIEKWRRFRRYVQICEGVKTYFKEFGDRRLVSAKTGKVYDEPGKTAEQNLAKMKEDESDDNARAATELLNFSLYNPAGAYGTPRWMGNILSVEGSHKSETVNYLFFDNNAIAPLAVLVEGGRLASGGIAALKEVLRKRRGAANFHKAILLEAAPATGSPAAPTADGKVRIKIQPLMDSILKDGLFMAYDQKNRDKIGESFRMPKLLRGDSSEINRATADAALAFAEQQVFSGERNRFDYQMDRTLLTDLDVKYFEFESLGPDLKNPEALARALKLLENFIKPDEGRVIVSDVFGRSFKPTGEDWAQKPIAVTLAEARAGGFPAAAGTATGGERTRQRQDAVDLAKQLVGLRKALLGEAGRAADQEFRADKRAAELDQEPEVIPLEPGALDSLLERG